MRNLGNRLIGWQSLFGGYCTQLPETDKVKRTKQNALLEFFRKNPGLCGDAKVGFLAGYNVGFAHGKDCLEMGELRRWNGKTWEKV